MLLLLLSALCRTTGSDMQYIEPKACPRYPGAGYEQIIRPYRIQLLGEFQAASGVRKRQCIQKIDNLRVCLDKLEYSLHRLHRVPFFQHVFLSCELVTSGRLQQLFNEQLPDLMEEILTTYKSSEEYAARLAADLEQEMQNTVQHTLLHDIQDMQQHNEASHLAQHNWIVAEEEGALREVLDRLQVFVSEDAASWQHYSHISSIPPSIPTTSPVWPRPPASPPVGPGFFSTPDFGPFSHSGLQYFDRDRVFFEPPQWGPFEAGLPGFNGYNDKFYNEGYYDDYEDDFYDDYEDEHYDDYPDYPANYGGYPDYPGNYRSPPSPQYEPTQPFQPIWF